MILELEELPKTAFTKEIQHSSKLKRTQPKELKSLTPLSSWQAFSSLPPPP
ncbi:hypothetical protein HanRHA438_Chr01g0013481 [Helianthus annuus]|nr:hypothetical protein HanHA300_Chr01g0010751 [Helianthus annuus]KAJ0621955.1 hypothetical protein HanIR_Chr01g0014621 [Helianthus annuus]KAJ0626310.1 hypothetical protein HanHA89_Chr01g0011701 [Helianthus annuus]KAJ0782656.1 hypothetical protein HanLR1_Chr01g0010741 [Helianthus annuus]KAJ0947283.1 hypothetical protein HanRHA438_Chr01g0013481 [Helianthus annuus]